MQIKFRCQHCNQLLGISSSRAGARVDCPGCGRSIHVPGAANRTAELSATDAAVRNEGKRDQTLDDALAALVQLSDRSSSSSLRQSGHPEHQSARSESQSQIIADIPDQGEAAVLIQELSEEMTSLADSAPPPRSPSHGDMSVAAETRTRSWISFPATILLCAASFTAGLGAMHFWHLRDSASDDNQSAGDSGSTQSGQNSADENSGAPTGNPVQESVGSQSTIVGTISWINDQGMSIPDSQALVLLLPRRTDRGIRFDGRSLRELALTTDQKALKAALRELNVSVTRADESGQFILNWTSSAESVLVAVSHHQSRAEDAELSADIAEVLSQYFESTNGFIGRLAVTSKVVPPANADENQISVALVISK
ncbi:MAG: hypothetical protein JNL58_21670 [Planctomyces sp.]|nr:hypothetical protein [Planctomyces sp.]